MSAQQTFAFCIDCWEFHYGIADSNGVYTRDSGSSNHWDHAVHVFRDPNEYAPPVRSVLKDLHRGALITDGRMEMFSLAIAVTAIQPNNGIRPDSERAQAAETFTPGIQPPIGGLSTKRLAAVGPATTAHELEQADPFGDAS